MTSPVTRALADCTRRGWIADTVDAWKVRPTGTKVHGRMSFHLVVKSDLWGIFDILALDPETGALYFIQVTSGSHHAARVLKCCEWPYLQVLLSHEHVHAEVWSYSKRVWRKKDGTKAARPRWVLRRENLLELIEAPF